MNTLLFLTLSIAFIGATNARMPADLSKFLGLSEEQEEKKPSSIDQADQTGMFTGSNFHLNRFNSQSAPNMASIETAKSKLRVGDVEEYMPRPIQTAECHVEYQVTERVPGRCTKLAGNIPACQTQRYIGINYSECS